MDQLFVAALERLAAAAERQAAAAERQAAVAEKIANALDNITRSPQLNILADSAERLSAHLTPAQSEIVDSGYVAGKLGCTTTWVSEMTRAGRIPKTCVVPGTGKGKLWKFYRGKIDAWIESR
jgi:hypothetical protein